MCTLGTIIFLSKDLKVINEILDTNMFTIKDNSFSPLLPSSTQAQDQLEAELALFSFDPAPHPAHLPVHVSLACDKNPNVTKLQSWAYLEYKMLIARLGWLD